MERLTMRNDTTKEAFLIDFDDDDVKDAIQKLADYEDAEEQGFLIRLPVPIGTKKLFYIEKGYVYELDATRLSISKFPVSDEIIYEYDFCEFSFDDFGKIVFLTEEEAKAALAEKGGAE